jgi:histone H3/H4
MSDGPFWKVCSICRNSIGFKAAYYVCSVSTCQRKRTGLVFCSPACFDAHVPMLRHRDAWAEQSVSPTEAEAELAESAERAESTGARAESVRRIVAAPVAAIDSAASDADDGVLIVTARLKKFIRSQSGMNTSDGVLPVLSEHVRQLSIQALRVAATDGRKTVLDRDFEVVLNGLRNK